MDVPRNVQQLALVLKYSKHGGKLLTCDLRLGIGDSEQVRHKCQFMWNAGTTSLPDWNKHALRTDFDYVASDSVSVGEGHQDAEHAKGRDQRPAAVADERKGYPGHG